MLRSLRERRKAKERGQADGKSSHTCSHTSVREGGIRPATTGTESLAPKAVGDRVSSVDCPTPSRGYCQVSVSIVHRVIAASNCVRVAAIETPGKGGRRHHYLTRKPEHPFRQLFVARVRSQVPPLCRATRTHPSRVGERSNRFWTGGKRQEEPQTGRSDQTSV